LNQIEIEDIKLWIGELVIENKLLQKKIALIEMELNELKAKIGANYNIQPMPLESENQN
jgi:hypothetical protein